MPKIELLALAFALSVSPALIAAEDMKVTVLTDTILGCKLGSKECILGTTTEEQFEKAFGGADIKKNYEEGRRGLTYKKLGISVAVDKNSRVEAVHFYLTGRADDVIPLAASDAR